MLKTRWRKIDTSAESKKSLICVSCGSVATKTVTFEDMFGKLIVILCEKCSQKKYNELLIQGRFSWAEK